MRMILVFKQKSTVIQMMNKSRQISFLDAFQSLDIVDLF